MRRCRLSIAFVVICSSITWAADVNVRDFGAIPNDGKDDTLAIQRAIDRAGRNSTITFPPGQFDVIFPIDPRGDGRTIKGSTTLRWDGDNVVADNQTIIKCNGIGFIFEFTGQDLKLLNLSFNGRTINCQRPNNVMVRGLIIDNCWFHLDVKGESEDAIQFTTGLADSKITNCVFDPIKGDNGIYGYNWDNLVIANNFFRNGNEGIHLTAHLDASRDLLIEQNYLSGLSRMGIEIQGGGNNTIVQDNYYEKPAMTENAPRNDETFAYSIVSDRSRGTKVLRNTSIAPERPDGVGVRIIFELGGLGFVCEQNYSVDGNHVIAVNGVNASGLVRRNLIKGFKEGPRNSNGARAQFLDNGPDVKLDWDVNRGKPGPNKRLPIPPMK